MRVEEFKESCIAASRSNTVEGGEVVLRREQEYAVKDLGDSEVVQKLEGVNVPEFYGLVEAGGYDNLGFNSVTRDGRNASGMSFKGVREHFGIQLIRDDFPSFELTVGVAYKDVVVRGKEKACRDHSIYGTNIA
jgi:hypothetical protein